MEIGRKEWDDERNGGKMVQSNRQSYGDLLDTYSRVHSTDMTEFERA